MRYDRPVPSHALHPPHQKILLFGPDGQVGSQLRHTLAPLGAVRTVPRAEIDLANADALRDLLREQAPDVIVNAAAYTAVDRAESERDLACAINCGAVRVMAEEARKSDALLVHYSTDYVFDGTRVGEYTEEDMPRPQSVYGSTKLAGERAIQESGCRHLILRTSWVYGTRGGNFPKAILRAARERDHLTVVDDQFGSPTSADLIADVTAQCVERMAAAPAQYPCGLYHLTASGRTSWYAYAKFLLETAAQAGLPLKATSENVEPISSERYGAAAKRPANSTLDTRKLQDAFAIELPHWTEHVRRFVEQVAAESVA